MTRMTGIVLLSALILTVAGVIVDPGITTAAAHACLVGSTYEHTMRIGDRDRLRQAGVAVRGRPEVG